MFCRSVLLCKANKTPTIVALLPKCSQTLVQQSIGTAPNNKKPQLKSASGAAEYVDSKQRKLQSCVCNTVPTCLSQRVVDFVWCELSALVHIKGHKTVLHVDQKVVQPHELVKVQGPVAARVKRPATRRQQHGRVSNLKLLPTKTLNMLCNFAFTLLCFALSLLISLTHTNTHILSPPSVVNHMAVQHTLTHTRCLQARRCPPAILWHPHLIIWSISLSPKCRLPSPSARCSSAALRSPLRSTSIESNHWRTCALPTPAMPPPDHTRAPVLQAPPTTTTRHQQQQREEEQQQIRVLAGVQLPVCACARVSLTLASNNGLVVTHRHATHTHAPSSEPATRQAAPAGSKQRKSSAPQRQRWWHDRRAAAAAAAAAACCCRAFCRAAGSRRSPRGD